ncbi:ribulose-phosphate 3-epimerase [Candidatus Lucifugimonas marina]|uniref:Ribulose-phosphate 3-epimerase n=1 Tax=Candidatus Lucifugimonas marina TaxID=3038979 RepID=A0AAJ5ZFA3_9CHLR|nr:ribulose-phosphate 3-epimerase [SAR202 cluster bacterium JH702]MDG0869603.1 ribulose-phosphate 3-epimerase [SAR202 cluster bacterium JH639]WFG34336.1 ribulose-phosphate 3-epimerase [SAR202 cluster bacterium JH545]WFG38265.1 ribulose-phosphate 3-epimerase [SAR202 cluster bacterium JH1073]
MAPLIKISPSLLAADFAHLADSIAAAEEAGADELHFDVMDGYFVPNITVGIPVLEAIRPLTKLPIDVHMMVHEPARYAQAFADAGGDIFTMHVEACDDLDASLGDARVAGMTAGVSLKPDTPASVLQASLPFVERVLVMTVEPGFGGQPFMPEMLPKITELQNMAKIAGHDLEIAVDGGIKVDTAGDVINAGATTLISGTGVFNYPDGMKIGIEAIRTAGS